jgi:hypothetical protein
MHEAIPAEVQALARLDLEGLRAAWRVRYGAPPPLRSRELLCLQLAFRIQADAWGGLSTSIKRVLRQPTPTTGPLRLSQGLKITKEWQGRRHEVETMPDGFMWDGRRYRSLSAVAFAITGAKWNGPRFFGFREPQA